MRKSIRKLTYIGLVVLGCLSLPVAAQDLSEKVSAHLESIKIQAHELDISNWRGVVTIGGWVSSETDKTAVLTAVKGIEGVDEVKDQLEVKTPGTLQFAGDDKQLSEARLEEVKSATEVYLKKLPVRGSYSLNYTLSDTGVVIGGELPAGVEVPALIYHLKRSVSSPVSQTLTVRPWPSDSDLAKRVRTDLSLKQGLDLNGITISAEKGVVTLAGHRANHSLADQLAAAVLMVEGVRDVKSEVTFEGSRGEP